MSDRQWPATIIGTAWLTYDPEDGWSEHDNPADAEREFGAIVDHLRDEASEGWHESADTAAWGIWIPIERLRLCATAWPDDGTEDGERCKDAGWDAFLSGNPEKVEIDAAAIDFCVRREAAAFAAMRERVEALEAERDEARAVIALIAEACATPGCEDLASALTPSDYGALVEHVAVIASACDALRAEVARLTRVLAVEQGDEDAAPEGWAHDIDLTDDDAVREYVWTGPSATVCGSPCDGWRVESAHTGRIVRALYDTAIEAMEAAACDRLGVDHG